MLRLLKFFGTVDAIGADSWTIAGMTLLITADTEIDEGLTVGSLVKVEATAAPDGTMTAPEIESKDDDSSGPGGGGTMTTVVTRKTPSRKRCTLRGGAKPVWIGVGERR